MENIALKPGVGAPKAMAGPAEPNNYNFWTTTNRIVFLVIFPRAIEVQ